MVIFSVSMVVPLGNDQQFNIRELKQVCDQIVQRKHDVASYIQRNDADPSDVGSVGGPGPTHRNEIPPMLTKRISTIGVASYFPRVSTYKEEYTTSS